MYEKGSMVMGREEEIEGTDEDEKEIDVLEKELDADDIVLVSALE